MKLIRPGEVLQEAFDEFGASASAPSKALGAPVKRVTVTHQ